MSTEMSPRIALVITLYPEKVPNFPELQKEEMVLVDKWKSEGLLENMYLLPITKNGAVLIFKNVDESQIRKMTAELPFYPYMDKVEFLFLGKVF